VAVKMKIAFGAVSLIITEEMESIRKTQEKSQLVFYDNRQSINIHERSNEYNDTQLMKRASCTLPSQLKLTKT
jgi:hypothetical protein